MKSRIWCTESVIFNDLWWPLTQISRARDYSTFNISNIANTVLYVTAKDYKRPSTLTGRNVRLPNLPSGSCLLSLSCICQKPTGKRCSGMFWKLPFSLPSFKLLKKVTNKVYKNRITNDRKQYLACCCKIIFQQEHHKLYVNSPPTCHRVARWLSGRASDLRSSSRGFKARPRRCCVTT